MGIGVSCIVDTDGIMMPYRVNWPDGRKWEIERVLHTCRSPDMSFTGIRYTVLICGMEKYLYRDDENRWYVVAAKQEEQIQNEDIGEQQRAGTGRRKPDS